MGDAASGILQRGGVRGLYAGIGVTLLEIMPYAAMQFGFYDIFTKAFMHAVTKHQVNALKWPDSCNVTFPELLTNPSESALAFSSCFRIIVCCATRENGNPSSGSAASSMPMLL